MAVRPVRRTPSARRARAVALVMVLCGMGVYIWQADPVPMTDDASPAEASSPLASPASRGDGVLAVYTGEVVQVADGDSIRFKTSSGVRRIRLDSIDAPELAGGPDRPGQPHAQGSRRHLAQWLSSRRVTAHCFAPDQYGRDVCILQDDIGETANRAQVAAGHAWAYTAAKGRYLRDVTLPGLQRDAREARRGLWADSKPVAPWAWRYACWRQHQCNKE